MIFTGIALFILLLILKFIIFRDTSRVGYTPVSTEEEYYCNDCFATFIQTETKKKLDEEIPEENAEPVDSDEDILTEF
jgi:hypothetical protein